MRNQCQVSSGHSTTTAVAVHSGICTGQLEINSTSRFIPTAWHDSRPRAAPIGYVNIVGVPLLRPRSGGAFLSAVNTNGRGRHRSKEWSLFLLTRRQIFRSIERQHRE